MSVRPSASSENVRYSIVVPVYRNEETLPALLERLDALAAGLDGPLETVFVVDGSPDASFALLREELRKQHAFSAQLIALSRNFGSFSAVKTGLESARGAYVAVMAADLQEPASLIERFFDGLASGEHDVAVGVRTARNDPATKAAAARLFWWLYRKLVQPEIPPGGVDVFACTSDVAAQLAELDESHTSLIGLLYWLGFRRLEVPYERQARPAGKSAWSLSKRIRYLEDSIYSFTSLPIAAITAVGVVGVVASLSYAAVVFVFWATGHIEVQGYTPLMLALLVLASSILIALGIVGSYVWRTYENSKRRPTAVTMTREEFEATAPTTVLGR
jgi:glycosyltransferase involved in cell wall biosynthesis